MPYQPLREILSALDAQQRQELTALSDRVEEAELQRARNARRTLSAIAIFFIERSWESIAPELEAFSLEAESRKSAEELRAYLRGLRNRQPAFAWGWIRARMEARLMLLLEQRVPDLLAQNPEKATLYTHWLRSVDRYWFRETPLHHLKAGYHTALGVACKWYGSAFELRTEAPPSCPRAAPDFQDELRMFASFSMTMLTRTDGYLWDSAGAEPLDAVLDGDTLRVASRLVAELSLETAPDYGLRLGCPALRARRENGTPAFAGMIGWVEQVFSHYSDTVKIR